MKPCLGWWSRSGQAFKTGPDLRIRLWHALRVSPGLGVGVLPSETWSWLFLRHKGKPFAQKQINSKQEVSQTVSPSTGNPLPEAGLTRFLRVSFPLFPGIRIFLENLRKPGENGWLLKKKKVEKNGESAPRRLGLWIALLDETNVHAFSPEGLWAQLGESGWHHVPAVLA